MVNHARTTETQTNCNVTNGLRVLEENRFRSEQLQFNHDGIIVDELGVEYHAVRRNEHHIKTAFASWYGLSDKVKRIGLTMELGVNQDKEARKTLYRTHEGDLFETFELTSVSGLAIRSLSAEYRDKSAEDMYVLGVLGAFSFAKAFGLPDIPKQTLSLANPAGHYDIAGYRIAIMTQPVASCAFVVPDALGADLLVLVQLCYEGMFRLAGWCTEQEFLNCREQFDLGFTTIFVLREKHLRDIRDLEPLLESARLNGYTLPTRNEDMIGEGL
jgi:hypothetical protein